MSPCSGLSGAAYMCVRAFFFSVSFLWVQVPGTGPKRGSWRRARQTLFSEPEMEEGGGGGGSLVLKGTENERDRKLWGD